MMLQTESACILPRANEILTAIVHSMREEEPSWQVRLAATNALQNSLTFIAANFNAILEGPDTRNRAVIVS